MKKRLLSLLLALAMLLSLIPMSAMAADAAVISEVEVWGLDVPVAGEEPDREAELIGNPNYTVAAPDDFVNFINGISWYDVTDGCVLLEGDVFQAGHQYQVKIGLKANDGYSFDSLTNMSATTNLSEEAYTGSFYGVDEGQYITVSLGSITFPIYMTAKYRSSVTVTNGVAYNADGEVITEALEGDTITVEGVPPVFYYAFKGWTVESPETLEGFDTTSYQTSFTMPATDVVITGNYEDDEEFYAIINYAFVNLDQCAAGREADFTPSNAAGETVYSGYHFVAPESHDASRFHNGVCWWNITDNVFLSPGDVFEEGKRYCVFVGIAPDAGFLFSEDLTTSLNYIGECSNVEDYGVDLSKGRVIQSPSVTPVTPYAINLMGATAYNDAGEVITEAIPGDTVTLIADEAGFGWKFDTWMIMGNADVEMDDITATTTTFVMPEQNVTIFSGYTEAEKVPVEQINLTLRGYYIGASVNCMQIEASGGAAVQTNTITDVDYVLIADNNGTPGTTAITSGRIYRDSVYWMGVLLEPEFGYTLDGLTAEQITFSHGTATSVSTNNSGQTVLFVKLNTASSLNSQGGAHTISVTNGTAYVNNTAVTGAVSSLKVRLEANEAPEGSYFSHWEVLSGNVILGDIYSPSISFTMGSSDVSFEAVYKEYISEVSVEILAPQAGMTPSYLAIIDLEAGYERDENDSIYCRSGVIWYDVDTEDNLDPATAVFQPGHCYGVQILLRAKDGEQFLLDDTGYPSVTGYVNGVNDAVYVEQYAEDSSVQVMLTTSFYIEEDAEIVPPVTEVNISIDDPVPGMILDYTPEWDYMEYVSPAFVLDDDDTLNGVTWTDVSVVPHVVMHPETDVAVQGQAYRVDMLICTTNNRIFAVDENGTPSINATVNGETCDVTVVNGLDSTRYLLLTYYVQIQSNYTLTVTNGMALADGNYITEGELAANTNVMLLPSVAPEGQVFSHWSITYGDTTENVEMENYEFSMPQSDVEATAVYVDKIELFDFAGATATLGGKLQLDFVFDSSKVTGEDNYVVITKYDASGNVSDTVIVAQTEWKTYSGTLVQVSYSNIAAKEMGDMLTAVVYRADGVQLSNIYEDSYKSYATRALAAANTINNAEMRTVFVDMLNYGAAAQVQFSYNTDNLVNAGLNETQQGWATSDVVMTNNIVRGPGYIGSTLTLESEIRLDFIFNSSVIGSDHSQLYAIATYTDHNGNAKSVRIEGADFGTYGSNAQISVTGMVIADYAQMVTCTVYDSADNVVGYGSDSVESYAARASSSTMTAAKTGVAIAKFGYSAYAYFH